MKGTERSSTFDLKLQRSYFISQVRSKYILSWGDLLQSWTQTPEASVCLPSTCPKLCLWSQPRDIFENSNLCNLAISQQLKYFIFLRIIHQKHELSSYSFTNDLQATVCLNICVKSMLRKASHLLPSQHITLTALSEQPSPAICENLPE